MALVTSKQIARAINLDKLGFISTFIGWILLKLLRISSLNKIYEQKRHLQGITFLTSVLNEFEVKYELPKEDLKRIPKEGAFITVSNHPLGGIDGIILLKLLSEQRNNVKTISNFLLNHIEPMRPYLIAVNPFENRKHISSIAGIKASLHHVKEGNPLAIFPAGEVSTQREGKKIVDKPWSESAIKVIQKSEVPVVPIYFHAKNSRFFYFLSRISSLLQTAKLPSELFSQREKTIRIRIGRPIKVEDQKNYEKPKELGDFLRKKTYMLANAFERERNGINSASLRIHKRPKKIATPKSREKIENEVNYLRNNDYLLLESKNYEVFFCPAKRISNSLHEIGRLREITFRAIGEGTNKSIDIDAYDYYYHHLFLWDNNAKSIVGAYRMGLGKEIFKKHGIKGFYVHSLFRFEPEIQTVLENSIEMGRAFIVKEYQQKPMPLFLLWKGIVHITLRYPEYKYLLGGVSISNQFSKFSKSLMIEFMKSHYYDPYIAQFIRPKKEYKVNLKDADKDFVFDETQADLNKFDRVIDEIEPGTLRIPVLIKKYLKQNAKVVAFNVDPKFNNAIDGLMYIRVSDIPESTVKPVLEEYQAILEKKLENNNSKNR